MANILIVDDDTTMVSLLSTLLELDGHRAILIDSHQSIMDVLERESIHVILMDVFLSGEEDGIQLLKTIREDMDLGGTSIVMTSGMDVSDQCLEAGADAFLLKPYDPDQLVEIIQQNIPSKPN